ncbi:MAG: fumarylacetoacetate hydrolase family protein [Acidobacteria bacterium]|nr:fumarylacetoacetate hydrolase family protein [Acidobacteriota bacterium]
MKYATYSSFAESIPCLSVVNANRILNIRQLVGKQWGGHLPESLLEFIQMGPAIWRRMSMLVGECLLQPLSPGIGHSLEEVRLHAPIPRPAKNIVCLGLNYKSHMEETARARGREVKIPEVPVFFTKAPTAVNGPMEAIPWDPSVTEQVDYEAELAVVIGISGKNIPRAKALEHVFGYMVLNDVTARDLQKNHLQWFKGKSLDGFCPMGPYLVTADEFGDPQKKRISLRVNGAVKQDATTADMIFPVAAIIESLSRGMSLEAGDIISTGTPEGVGLGRTPPEFLKEDDLVEAEVEGIGILRNRVVVSRHL